MFHCESLAGKVDIFNYFMAFLKFHLLHTFSKSDHCAPVGVMSYQGILKGEVSLYC
jgi:hypothetical protein